jgi:hypothetical protein
VRHANSRWEEDDTVTVRAAFGYFRLALAIVCLVSLVSRFMWGLGSATFQASNFFGYLTMQSNISFTVISVVAAIVALTRADDPDWLTTVRTAVLAFTVSSGVIFAILVQQSGARGFSLVVPWSDQVLHFWLPAFALIEWIAAPGRGKAPWTTVTFAVIFTVVWGILTLIRGAIVGWYPYFFLDPNQVSSLWELAYLSAIAIAFIAALTTAVVALTRRPPLVPTDVVVRLPPRPELFGSRPLSATANHKLRN